MSHIDELRRLAGILISSEEADATPASRAVPTFNFAKLGPPLDLLMGRAGFRMLLRDALSRSKREMPWLLDVWCNDDGSFEGLEQVYGRVTRERFIQSHRYLLAHILALLVRFIGAGMTRAIVLETWPQVAEDDVVLGSKSNDRE